MTNDDQLKNTENLTPKQELEQEENLMDHDYDGIHELDNPPPMWIMAIFYMSIFIAIMYAAHYHWFNQGPNQDEEYLIEMAEHLEKYGSQESNETLAILTDEASIKEGEMLYQKNCIACHAPKGEGGIGANLTDANWIHGCDFESVFNVVKNGAPNGMISYKTQMSDKKIQELTSYILTKLKDTNVEGKAVEGEACQ